jgi:hypothetical protein
MKYILIKTNKVLLLIIVISIFLTTTVFNANAYVTTNHQSQEMILESAVTLDSGWYRAFGGKDDDYGYSVLQASDGGFIIAGTMYFWNGQASNSNVWDAALVKTDINGNKEWQRTYGGRSWDYGFAVQHTADNGYIIAGKTESYGAGQEDAWLIKTDENGFEQWNKTYGDEQINAVGASSCVQQTEDGGYILVGYTFNLKTDSYDAWLIKTDENGNEQWNKTYGGPDIDVCLSVQQTDDLGYILCGYTYSYGAGLDDVWLIKTDANGNEQWNKTFGGANYDVAYQIQKTADGGYILGGKTASYGLGSYDFWLIKTDENGVRQWDETYGGTGSEEAKSVQLTNDGGYVLFGGTDSYGVGGYDFWLVKTDGNGVKQWDKTYGGSRHDYGFCVKQTNDDGYILGGYTSSHWEYGGNDFWLVKTDANGNAPYHPPTAPVIKGRRICLLGTYKYTFKSSDAGGGDIKYYIDWDGGGSWTDYYPAGQTITFSNTWTDDWGIILMIKTVTAFAKDTTGLRGPGTELKVIIFRIKWFTDNFVFLHSCQQSQNIKQTFEQSDYLGFDPDNLPSCQTVGDIL